MEDFAATVAVIRAIQKFLISKLNDGDRDELNEVCRTMLQDMNVATEGWSNSGDPQKYRDGMARELMEIMNLPRCSFSAQID